MYEDENLKKGTPTLWVVMIYYDNVFSLDVIYNVLVIFDTAISRFISSPARPPLLKPTILTMWEHMCVVATLVLVMSASDPIAMQFCALDPFPLLFLPNPDSPDETTKIWISDVWQDDARSWRLEICACGFGENMRGGRGSVGPRGRIWEVTPQTSLRPEIDIANIISSLKETSESTVKYKVRMRFVCWTCFTNEDIIRVMVLVVTLSVCLDTLLRTIVGLWGCGYIGAGMNVVTWQRV